MPAGLKIPDIKTVKANNRISFFIRSS